MVSDVAAILAQVHGQPIAARRCDDLRCADWIGMFPAARITDRGDMVDVDAQTEALCVAQRHDFTRLPGWVTGTAASAGGTSSGAYVGKLSATRA